jgi:hypothetical protein
VKFSVDQGVTWSPPQPVVVNGLPPGFQRPFDPAIAITDAGGYRLYFSSGILPVAGADSTIDTYSAIGSDGIHYQFEPGARVNHPTKRMIDPAVLKFHGLWHYTAPVGAPQEGSYHYISGDGINFQVTPVIPSDPAHNWTGNLMTESDAEMRFYGSGPWIWYRVTPDGGLWYPPVNTNLHGGDPACIKLAPGSYLVIYTGLNPAQAIRGNDEPRRVSVVPNPAGNEVWIEAAGARELAVFSIDGQPMIRVEPPASRTSLGLTGLAPGVYILRITFPDRVETTRLMKN